MKIGIEARALSASAGVRHYAYELIRHLLALGRDDYVVIYDQKKILGTFSAAQEIAVPLRHELLVPWWLNKIPKIAQAQHVDVMHYTKGSVPRERLGPTVVTIHDVIPMLFPGSQKFPQSLYWPRALRHAAERADHILTISQQSQADIVKRLAVAPEKITAIPLGIDLHRFHPATATEIAAARTKYSLTEPYVLFVGTLEPRKNIPALLRAYAQLRNETPHHLVIVGKKGWRTAAIEKALQSFPEPQRLHWLNYVTNDDLISLYSGATIFVWPSVYEGWGFPPLEAMACGTPVIVSSGGSLPEVVGEAGHIIPFSTDDVAARTNDALFEQKLTQAMGKLLSDVSAQEMMRTQGLVQAARFSWEKVAKKTREVYQQVSH
ncbi:MAG: glycosyltransferase family 1 protein [Candidatus Andersenbacteria bacterium]